MATTLEKTNGLPVTYRASYPIFGSEFLFGDEFLAPFNALRRAMLTPLAAPWALPDLPALTAPAVNLYEKDGGYMVEFSVPGYTKNDLTIEVSGYILTVTGKVQTEKQNGKKYHFHELSNSSFSRTLSLPVEINPAQVTATVENGILRIALQPMKMIQRTTIPITG